MITIDVHVYSVTLRLDDATFLAHLRSVPPVGVRECASACTLLYMHTSCLPRFVSGSEDLAARLAIFPRLHFPTLRPDSCICACFVLLHRLTLTAATCLCAFVQSRVVVPPLLTFW